MIKNKEDAAQYMQEVESHLNDLVTLSLDAGLYRHAGIWHTIHGALIDSADDIETIATMMEMYIDRKLQALNGPINLSQQGDKP